MNKELQEELEVLTEKRKLIKEELQETTHKTIDIEKKLRELNKELKGSYNVEKQILENTYNHLNNDISGYEEAIHQPYFGRVDFMESRGNKDIIYIGKKGISNVEKGEEIVVDWRAPVADLYYSGTGGNASYKAPSGSISGELELKRKFLFNEENIERIFDEGINEIIISGEEGQGLIDEFLKVNLEANGGKKLKEVVATIQKEQNDIIRWSRNSPIIVQGSAGSGKTTIALHRLAYLIYKYGENIKGEDILVLAPNKLFLDYISDILPSLDAGEVKQSTYEDFILLNLKIKNKVYNKDEKLMSIMEEKDAHKRKLLINSSKIKGTLTYRTMIDRYISLVERRALDIKDIIVEENILFEKKEIMRLYLKDLKSYPINKRKDEIKRYLKLKIKEKIQIILNKIDLSYDKKVLQVKNLYEGKNEYDRRQKLIELYDERDELKSNIKNNALKEFNLYFKNWRSISAKDLYYNFFNDKELFKISTNDRIPEVLSDYMKEEFNRNYENNIIDEDDLSALAYIKILLEGIDESTKFQHIVVDEIQDYSQFQVYIVDQFTRGSSLTLVGDLAQGIYYYKGLKTWNDILDGVFKGNATFIQLTQSYRSTVEILNFASKTLKAQDLNLKDSKPVLRHGELPQLIEVEDEKDYVIAIEKIIKLVKEKCKNSIAIITKDSEEAIKLYKSLKSNSNFIFELIKEKEKKIENDFIIIPSYLTKGLEFDCTVILNPTEEKYGFNLLDERLLYVSLTRALHLEFIIKKDNITKLI